MHNQIYQDVLSYASTKVLMNNKAFFFIFKGCTKSRKSAIHAPVTKKLTVK